MFIQAIHLPVKYHPHEKQFQLGHTVSNHPQVDHNQTALWQKSVKFDKKRNIISVHSGFGVTWSRPIKKQSKWKKDKRSKFVSFMCIISGELHIFVYEAHSDVAISKGTTTDGKG